MQSRRLRQAASPHQEPEAGRTRFVADAMLGSLARKLRAFGYDTTYFRDGDDSSLLQLAKKEKRIILTSDRTLSERCASRGIGCLAVQGTRESARLSSLGSGARSRGITLVRGPRRCSVCNGGLVAVEKSKLEGLVSSKLAKRHRLFHQCVDCGRIYWRGSHWKKLRWLETRLTEK